MVQLEYSLDYFRVQVTSEKMQVSKKELAARKELLTLRDFYYDALRDTASFKGLSLYSTTTTETRVPFQGWWWPTWTASSVQEDPAGNHLDKKKSAVFMNKEILYLQYLSKGKLLKISYYFDQLSNNRF